MSEYTVRSITYTAGYLTAYGAAKEGGYTGTYEEFCAAIAGLEGIVEDLDNFSVVVSTLAAGSSATASYADGVLTLGIPKGDKGDQGDQGIPGEVQDDIIADEFSASTAYTKGTMVMKESVLYRFTADHAAGAWTGTDVETVQVGEELTDLKGAFNQLSGATLITDTASGAIASFPDGASMPVKSLSVDIDPVQDLHGYDNPWPGGGTKNKFPNAPSGTVTQSSVTGTSKGDGTYIINGTNNTGNYIQLVFDLAESVVATSSQKIYINSTFSGTVSFLKANGDRADYWSVAGNDRLITDISGMVGQSVARIRFDIATGTSHSNESISVMLLDNSITDYTFIPYSNICPISGWTGVDVTRCGGNMLDFTVQNQSGITASKVNGKAVLSGTASGTSFPVNFVPTSLPPGKYVWSVSGLETGMSCSWTKNRALWGGYVTTGTVITLTEEAEIGGYVSINNGTVVDATVAVMLERGETAHDFEPYNPVVIPITWQSEAGTVYGGTLDVTSGVLTVTMANVDMSTLDWTYYDGVGSDPFFYTTGLAIANGTLNYLCDRYKHFVSFGDNMMSVNGTMVRAYVSAYTDATTFKNSLQGSQFVYELAEPVTYQLDPVTLRTLLGQNNIWNTSGSTSVTYCADTALYIEKKLSS